MSSKNDSNWYQNYEALKVYIQERGHLPDKHVEGSVDRYWFTLTDDSVIGRNSGGAFFEHESDNVNDNDSDNDSDNDDENDGDS